MTVYFIGRKYTLRSYAECQARHAEKAGAMLRFLKDDTYSDKATLMSVTGIKDSRNFYRFMEKFVRLGFIQKHVFDAPGGTISLWGITQDGIGEVFEQGEEFPNKFEPSKITGWGLQHHLFAQQIRLIFESEGATQWINGDRKNFLSQFDVKHRPDAVITLANGTRVAIEAERRLKTKVRYQEIMKSHLVARKADKWQRVYYILPDEQRKSGLIALFDSIKFLTFSGRPISIEKVHRDVFRFFTLADLIKNES